MFDLCFLHCVCPWILLASTVKPLSLPPSLYKPICLNLPLPLLSPFACLCPTSFSYYYKHIFIDIFTGASNGFYWRRQRWNFTCQKERGELGGEEGSKTYFLGSQIDFPFPSAAFSRHHGCGSVVNWMIAFYLLYFYSFTLAQPPQTHTHSQAYTQSGTLLHTHTHTKTVRRIICQRVPRFDRWLARQTFEDIAWANLLRQ